jgi:hypothetical protein
MLDIFMLATEPFGTWGPGTGGETSFFSWAYWQQGGSGASRSEIFRNFGLLAAALVGLGFGVWRAITAYFQTRASQRQADAANEQARIAGQGLFTDRFSTAVEHLGNKELPVRLGGIYALWRLGQDSPERDLLSVVDILCAFVRHPPHEPRDRPEPDANQNGQGQGDEEKALPKLRPDVQTVMNLIGRDADYREILPAGYVLDLTDADLADAELMGFNLTDAFLAFAKLMGAGLMGANFTNAILIAANLTRANLADANLTDADLEDADLTDAKFEGADLTGAKFEGAVNIPDLSLACADPNNPPRGLPEDVKRPEPWEPCPEK